LALFQPPLATHELAFVLDHVSTELPPEATLVGFAVKVAVGVVAGSTVTVALAPALSPLPVQVIG
jgi:hypothetical protein